MNSLKDKVCMITGATSGIGQVAANKFAAMGAELFLVCRNLEKAQHTVAAIIDQTGNQNITVLKCNLASLSEVREIAQTFRGYDKPLHVLLNNAAVFNMRREVTVDNHEEMFAVNHLAHFLLTNLLLEPIKNSSPARIVNVASDAHWFHKGIRFEDLSFDKGFEGLKVYGHSKLANILFTRELARRLEGTKVTVNALDPGGMGVSTGLGKQNGFMAKVAWLLLKPFMLSVEKGAKAPIYACTSTELDTLTGRYFKGCREVQPKPWALDDAAARQLWKVSEELTGINEHIFNFS